MKVALFEPERTQPTSVSGLQAVVPHSIIERPLSAHLHHCIERADYGDATVFTINPHANIPYARRTPDCEVVLRPAKRDL